MKRLTLGFIAILVLLSLASCAMIDVLEFSRDGVTYYYEYSDGIKSITNYHPFKIWSMPNYQELVQYGDGAGLENEGVVYFIYVIDISMDPSDTRSYYTAELDGNTKEILFEEGEYFSSETKKNATINRLIELIDSAYFK